MHKLTDRCNFCFAPLGGKGGNMKIVRGRGFCRLHCEEIYEGDVVKYTTNYYGKLKTENKQTIEWINDMEHDGFGEPLGTGFLLRGYDWEIIGNVHENPELLPPSENHNPLAK